MRHIWPFSMFFSDLYRWTCCMLTCSALSGECSRIGSSQELCRVSIIWLPRCTCNGQGLKWAEPRRRCSAIGSVFYRVSELLDWSWSTALQGRATPSWSRMQQMPTVCTHSAGSTQDTDAHLWFDTGALHARKHARAHTHIHSNTLGQTFLMAQNQNKGGGGSWCWLPHVNFFVVSCFRHTWFLANVSL